MTLYHKADKFLDRPHSAGLPGALQDEMWLGSTQTTPHATPPTTYRVRPPGIKQDDAAAARAARDRQPSFSYNDAIGTLRGVNLLRPLPQPLLPQPAKKQHTIPPLLGKLPAVSNDFQEEVRLELANIQTKLDSVLENLGASLQPASSARQMESFRRTLSLYSRGTPVPTSARTALGAVFASTPDASKLEKPLTDKDIRDSFQTIASSMQGRQSVRRSSLVGDDMADKVVTKAVLITRLQGTRPRVLNAIWDTLENPDSSNAAQWLAWCMPKFIILTVLTALLHTIAPPVVPPIFGSTVEAVIEGLYVLEFLARLVSCPNHRTFFRNAHNLIDFAAAAPLALRVATGFALPETQEKTLHEAVIYGGVPIARLLKLLRRFEKFHLLLKAFELAAEALPVLLFILSAIGLLFSVLIYLVEERSNVASLASAAWFTIVTMTTVGYGDITPKTVEGSIITSVLIVITALYMAIPLGIVGSAFTTTWNDRDRLLLMQRTRDKLMQWGYTAHDIPELFRLSDRDDDGELDLAEFRELVRCLQLGFSDDRVLQLFNSFDENRSGRIDDKEFIRGLFPHDYHEIYARGSTRSSIKVSQAGSRRNSRLSGPLPPRRLSTNSQRRFSASSRRRFSGSTDSDIV